MESLFDIGGTCNYVIFIIIFFSNMKKEQKLIYTRNSMCYLS